MLKLTAFMSLKRYHFQTKRGITMGYILIDTFRVTAFSIFGKAEASFDTPSFPEEHMVINFLLDHPGCEAKVERVYSVKEIKE